MQPTQFKKLKDTLPVKKSYGCGDIVSVIMAANELGFKIDNFKAAQIVKEMALECHAEISETVSVLGGCDKQGKGEENNE